MIGLMTRPSPLIAALICSNDQSHHMASADATSRSTHVSIRISATSHLLHELLRRQTVRVVDGAAEKACRAVPTRFVFFRWELSPLLGGPFLEFGIVRANPGLAHPLIC